MSTILTSKTGLYIGRFQPFHIGHLSAIKQALKKVDQLFIGIGSSQYSHEPGNPFTAQEREKMIELGLKDHELSHQCEIFLIPDIHNDEGWVEHVESILPKFDKVFVGNKGVVKQLFEVADYPVHIIEREIEISATAIRAKIKKKENWRRFVSPSVFELINHIKDLDLRL